MVLCYLIFRFKSLDGLSCFFLCSSLPLRIDAKGPIASKYIKSGIKIDKPDKFMYIPNDDKQNYLFSRLKLVVETFCNSTK